MSVELNEKLDQIGSTFEEYKKINDKRLEELKKVGTETTETKQALERANAELDKLNEEVKHLHVAMNRLPNAADGEEKKTALQEKLAEYKEVFGQYIRQGNNEAEVKSLSNEIKALSSQNDEDGGFIVDSVVSDEIVKKVFETSPMRQVASIQTISSNSLEILQDLDEADAAWVNEQEARPETDTPKLKMIEIPVHELYAKPKASQRLLDDARFNVELWLAEKVADKFMRTEATAFISGNGVGKPQGILSYASGTSGFNQIEQVGSGQSGTFDEDSLVDLRYALKGPYLNGSNWFLSRATLKAVRKLKDQDGQYIWQPGLQPNQPDMILGYPALQADDMPAVAASALPIAFGNFRAGYQIVDRFGIRVLRDPFSAKPHVEFYTTKRVGGAVKNFEAIKLMLIDP